jgi:hypothetical protein
MISIFTYLSYREFLVDAYGERKRARQAFSYRFIAGRLGINASTFVRILQGKRNLTQKMIVPVADLFKLGRRETAYFGLLVNLEQARNDQEKKLYFEKAVSFNKSEVTTLLADRLSTLRENRRGASAGRHVGGNQMPDTDGLSTVFGSAERNFIAAACNSPKFPARCTAVLSWWPKKKLQE